jgi:hypothetical protein
MATLKVVDEIHVSTHQLPTVWNRSAKRGQILAGQRRRLRDFASQKVQAMLKLYLDELLDEGDGGR